MSATSPRLPHVRTLPGIRLTPLALAVACVTWPVSAAADDAATALPTVVVSASSDLGETTEGSNSYTTGQSTTATRLRLTPRETPQSVTTVTRTRMDDFGLDNINDVLENTTGIHVEQVETDRTYYTARGFDITNFQFDGIGVPFSYGNVVGDIDTAIYDHIDVLRGANGLLSPSGNPSAAINFVLKRPTRERQASVGVTVGSWQNRRVDADVAGALNASGSVRGRVVGAYQDKESWLDRYGLQKDVFLGVIEADLGTRNVLSIGYSQQHNNADSPLWGALPLLDSTGKPTDFKTSTSNAADWAYWNGKTSRAIAELASDLGDGWESRVSLSRLQQRTQSKLFYVYGTPDPSTPGSDLYAYPSRYDALNTQLIADAYASGPFRLAGREHEAMFGLSASRSELKDVSHYGQGIGTELTWEQFLDGSYPEPTFDAAVNGSRFTDKQLGAYAAVRFNLSDRLKTLAGARLSDVDSSGENYGVDHRYGYRKTIPYAGVTYALDDKHMAYASYTGIFNPQTKFDRSGGRLAPTEGRNYEAGLKSALFARRLNTSLAVFKVDQKNYGFDDGFITGTFTQAHKGVEANSTGYELDASGEALPGLQLAAGYTQLRIEDKDGRKFLANTPKRLLRTSASYRIPAVEQLKVGASVNWQDDIRSENDARIRQNAYTLVNLMARYEFSPRVSATLNVNNVTDEKYLTSLYWDQSYYGAPRHANVTLNWTY